MFTIVSRLICFFSYQIWSVDEDECAENTHNCDSNSYCKNAPGSFHCHCKHGFSRDKSSSCSGRNIMLLCNQRHLIFLDTPKLFSFSFPCCIILDKCSISLFSISVWYASSTFFQFSFSIHIFP